MVAQMWLDAVSGYAQLWGLPPEAMLLIVSIVFAIGAGAGAGFATRNKSFAIFSFFSVLFLETMMGMLDIIFLMVGLFIVIGVYWSGVRG